MPRSTCICATRARRAQSRRTCSPATSGIWESPGTRKRATRAPISSSSSSRRANTPSSIASAPAWAERSASARPLFSRCTPRSSRPIRRGMCWWSDREQSTNCDRAGRERHYSAAVRAPGGGGTSNNRDNVEQVVFTYADVGGDHFSVEVFAKALVKDGINVWPPAVSNQQNFALFIENAVAYQNNASFAGQNALSTVVAG